MPAGNHANQVVERVTCAVITVSDTRTSETDTSGRLIRGLLVEAGHRVCAYELLPDEPARIGTCLRQHTADPDCRAILLSGGTGLAGRDRTYETVADLLDKRVDGFGELFRTLSYEEIGPAAMLSRAVAGVIGSTAVFSMPGSTGAVRLAMEKLILPEIGHVVWLLDQP